MGRMGNYTEEDLLGVDLHWTMRQARCRYECGLLTERQFAAYRERWVEANSNRLDRRQIPKENRCTYAAPTVLDREATEGRINFTGRLQVKPKHDLIPDPSDRVRQAGPMPSRRKHPH